MTDLYQVVAECVYATVDSPVGPQKTILYKGAVLPGTCPELEHLKSNGMVAKFGGESDGTGLNATGGLGEAVGDKGDGPGASGLSVVSPETVNPETVDPEVAQARVEAQRKLPLDGSAPDGRSSEAVWVEYAVSKGVDRGEAEKAGKEELRKLLASR